MNKIREKKEMSVGSAYIAAIITIIFWGFSFIWSNNIIKAEVPIFTFLFVRLAIAGTTLLLFSKLTGKLQKVGIKDLLLMCLMAFFEPFIYFIGESYGMKATGSGVLAAIIIATIPIACMIAEKLLSNVKFTLQRVLGILITIPGIVMVIFKDEVISVEHWYGIALLFMAVLGGTGYAVVVKKLTDKYNSFTVASYQFTLGALMFLPFFIAYGVDGVNAKLFTLEILGPILALAILCSCVAFTFWVSAIRVLGITRANVFTALIPAVSAVAAMMIGDEQITVLSGVGILIVICGVILAQRK